MESISLSEKTLQASAEVVQLATPRASTLFWETSAELVAAMINATGPASAGPVALCLSGEQLKYIAPLEIQREISAGR